MPSSRESDSLALPEAEGVKNEKRPISIETVQQNADIRVKRAAENRQNEDAERKQAIAQTSRKINAQPDQITITDSALEQLTKSGISERLVGIMRSTFNNQSIQVKNCSFAAVTRLVRFAGSNVTHRSVLVTVHGSENQLSFGFEQSDHGAKLGQLQLDQADAALIQSIFQSR